MAISMGIERIGEMVNAVKDAGNPFMRLVFNATGDNNDHSTTVPYFVLENIRDAAFQSESGCEAIHKAIFQRLDNTNVIVIRKTLEICRYLIIEGPPQLPRMLYTQSAGKILNIVNMRRNNPDMYIPKDSIEQGNIYLAEAVYKGISGDTKAMIEYGASIRGEIKNRDLKMGGAGGLSAVTYKSDFKLHQEQQQKAFKKRREEDRARANGIISTEKVHESFDGTLPPSKLVDSAVSCQKKKFSKEEMDSFIEASIDTKSIVDVCSCLDNVLKDGKSTLQVRYKILSLVEALITELPEALMYFEEHNLGIHRHLSIEQNDNPTKSALMQQLAKRCMDIVHRKVEVPSSIVIPQKTDEWETAGTHQDITPQIVCGSQQSNVNTNNAQTVSHQQHILGSTTTTPAPQACFDDKWELSVTRPKNQVALSGSTNSNNSVLASDPHTMAIQLQQQMSAMLSAAGGTSSSLQTAKPILLQQQQQQKIEPLSLSDSSAIDNMFDNSVNERNDLPGGWGCTVGSAQNNLTHSFSSSCSSSVLSKNNKLGALGNEAMNNGQYPSPDQMCNASLPIVGNKNVTALSIDQSQIMPNNNNTRHTDFTCPEVSKISSCTTVESAVEQLPTNDIATSIQKQMIQMNDLMFKALNHRDVTPMGDHTPENTIMSQMQGFQNQMQQMMTIMMSLQQRHQSAAVGAGQNTNDGAGAPLDTLLAKQQKEIAEEQQRQAQLREAQLIEEKRLKRVKLVSLLKELQSQMFVTQNMLVQQHQQFELLKTQARELL